MSRICVVRCHHFRDTRVVREVTALLDAGHEVDVVCLRDRGEPARERRGKLIIRRLPMSHSVGAGPRRLLSEYLCFFGMAMGLVGALHLRRRFAVVQVNSVPDVLVFAAILPRLTGSRILLDLQEPMPEFFRTRFQVRSDHLGVRTIAALETGSIGFAHHVITVTEPMRRAFVLRGAPADKITVVMDGSDETVFDPERVATADDRGRFVLISHGTIEPQYGLDTAINAVAELRSDIPEIQLQIFGDGSQRGELQNLARRLGVDDHVWFSDGFVPVDELVAALAGADVGVVAMRRDAFRDLTIAGKMFDFIAMGKPMVVGRTRAVVETFGEDCFEPFISGRADDLARAVRRLYRDRALADEYVRRASATASGITWRVQKQKYLQVIDDLLSRT